MEAIILSLLAGSVGALPAASSAPPAIPISYTYGGYPRVQTDITWGTPAQQFVPTIFDTGSSGFWVYGPKAIINDGSQYHYTQGPCNKSVTNFFNWPASSSHTKYDNKTGYAYGYGGNGKLVNAPSSVYDTISFTNKKWPAVPNTQVALSNFTVVSQLDDGCKIAESTFDHSILGLAPVTSATTGPSLRGNLLKQGKTKSSSFSMWFDKAPSSTKGKYLGTAVFGAVPGKTKYSGELVRLKQNPPEGAYVGFYVSPPKLTTTSIKKPGKPQTIAVSDTNVKQCLLDSGTGVDRLPFSSKQLLSVTGLIEYNQNAVFVAWNGSCDSIPATATLNYTFTGSTAGKTVTVAVPIRSYAGGIYDTIPGVDPKKLCPLSIELDEVGSCTFGAPFFTAAFAVFNDDKKQVALAQGGVSTGAADGTSSLGALTTIGANQDVPGSV